MSSLSSTHGNSHVTQEIKPHILHNRMPPMLESHVLANCTQHSPLMSQGGQDVQLLGHRFGFGYHHLYPYGGYGGYGGYGIYGGYGYPYYGCYPYGCGRGSIWNYPWY